MLSITEPVIWKQQLQGCISLLILPFYVMPVILHDRVEVMPEDVFFEPFSPDSNIFTPENALEWFLLPKYLPQ
jgi:hypothetical protein